MDSTPGIDGLNPPAAQASAFSATHWTVILAARHPASPDADHALEVLCRTYWYPLYAFVRRQGRTAHDAQDLVQGFFASLLQKDFLNSVEPTKGRFRSFLLASLKNFLADERDRAQALKPPGEGELTTNHVAWKHKKGVASVSSPLFYRGRVYAAQDGGRLTCFNAKSGGKFFEQERLGADGDYYASPIAANGHVYVSSGKGRVTVIEAGDTLLVKARNGLGEPIYATPAIVDDKLYVRSERHLWAFGR